MCPLCAVSITTWLVAGGAGSGVVLTATLVLAKARGNKARILAKNRQLPGRDSARK